jgi:hypothetical protein
VLMTQLASRLTAQPAMAIHTSPSRSAASNKKSQTHRLALPHAYAHVRCDGRAISQTPVPQFGSGSLPSDISSEVAKTTRLVRILAVSIDLSTGYS